MRDRDRRNLLLAYAVSAAGSGLGSGALPIIAVLVLHASAFEVSMLSGLAGLTAAAVLLPLGAGIEHRRKRPVMIAADPVQFAALASVPAAAALHLLTYPQLVAVGAISTAASIAFGAASGAHLKAMTDLGVAAARREQGIPAGPASLHADGRPSGGRPVRQRMS